MMYLDIDGIKVPLKIIEERRAGARVALGGRHVILRVPKRPFFKTDIEPHIHWAKQWLIQLRQTKPKILDRYLAAKEYENGQIFEIGGIRFLLNIQESDRQTGHIKLEHEAELKITVPNHKSYDKQKLIKTLLIKFSQKYFLPVIYKKVEYFNSQYIHQDIGDVRLKYNKSNWGSCSSGKNLNFSVRLFFAPDDVIDYVVIHELAHLIEMNHSAKFWKIVSKVMPNYKEKEKVLSSNSSLFDF